MFGRLERKERTKRQLKYREQGGKVFDCRSLRNALLIIRVVRLIEQHLARVLPPSTGAQQRGIRVVELVFGLERDA